MTGRKSAHTSSKTLEIHKVFPTAFSSSGRLSAAAKLLAPDSDGFSSDFCFLRRRCVVTHQDEKARPTSRTPSKAQRSGFVRKKEEGESIMEFSPQGGNGMAQTSSDAVRRMCSCQSRVLMIRRLIIRRGRRIFSTFSAAERKNTAPPGPRRGGRQPLFNSAPRYLRREARRPPGERRWKSHPPVRRGQTLCPCPAAVLSRRGREARPQGRRRS